MSVTTDRRPSDDGPAMHDVPVATPDRDEARALSITLPRQRTVGDGGDAEDAGDRVLRGTRALLTAFVVFTALATVSLVPMGGNTEATFAWTIHSRPNASFLGVAYLAGFVLSVLALRRRRWSEIRVSVITVTAFTVLTLVPTLLHLHKFHLMAEAGSARLAAWVWLVVYLIVPVAGIVVIVRQALLQHRYGRGTDQREERVVARPMPVALAAVLLAQGTLMAAAGAVLVGGGAMTHMAMDVRRPGWAWPVMPLTSQAIGGWLVVFAIAIVLALRERDLSRMFVPALAYAVFGAVELAVLLVCRTMPGTNVGWWWVDTLVLASLVPAGAYGAWVARRRVDA
jgi:hypothetical protein